MRTNLLTALSAIGDVRRIAHADAAPTEGFFIYAVLNGEDVFQVGYGSGDRMRRCTRGGLAGRHNKAFICAIGEAALSRPNDYAFVTLGTERAARAAEQRVHESLGIATNADAACRIRGITDDGATSIEDVTRALWARLVEQEVYRQLPTGQRAMADELMELVTWGTIREPNRKTCQGDILEGHMLEKIGKAHLINVFQRLTADYLRYGRHRLSDAEFLARADGYRYERRGGHFEIVVESPEEGQAGAHRAPRRIPVRAATAARVPNAVVPPQPPGHVHQLRQKTRLLFDRNELANLPADSWIEFDVVNDGLGRAEPRRVDVTFRCQVRDVATFFDTQRDVNWVRDGEHSWSRFPDWAKKYVVRGRIGT